MPPPGKTMEPPARTPQQNQSQQPQQQNRSQQQPQQQHNPPGVNRSVHPPSQRQYPFQPPPNQNIANPPRSKASCGCKLKTALYITAAFTLATQLLTCVIHSSIHADKYRGNYCVGSGCRKLTHEVQSIPTTNPNNYVYNQGRYSSSSNLEALLTIAIFSALDVVVTIVFIISVAKTRKPLCYTCFLIGLALKFITFASGVCYYNGANHITSKKQAVLIISILLLLILASFLGIVSTLVYKFVTKTEPEISRVGRQTPTQVTRPVTRTLNTPANASRRHEPLTNETILDKI